ncbi:MAG TPA: hypothetical protein VE619_02805 [Nitrososphaeraceae archaeon]|nr:hypothetical protein [Nitrososphaeraceae archaeon]
MLLIQEILKILLYLHRIQLGVHILSKMPNSWYVEGGWKMLDGIAWPSQHPRALVITEDDG